MTLYDLWYALGWRHYHSDGPLAWSGGDGAWICSTPQEGFCVLYRNEYSSRLKDFETLMKLHRTYYMFNSDCDFSVKFNSAGSVFAVRGCKFES